MQVQMNHINKKVSVQKVLIKAFNCYFPSVVTSQININPDVQMEKGSRVTMVEKTVVTNSPIVKTALPSGSRPAAHSGQDQHSD